MLDNILLKAQHFLDSKQPEQLLPLYTQTYIGKTDQERRDVIKFGSNLILLYLNSETAGSVSESVFSVLEGMLRNFYALSTCKSNLTQECSNSLKDYANVTNLFSTYRLFLKNLNSDGDPSANLIVMALFEAIALCFKNIPKKTDTILMQYAHVLKTKAKQQNVSLKEQFRAYSESLSCWLAIKIPNDADLTAISQCYDDLAQIMLNKDFDMDFFEKDPSAAAHLREAIKTLCGVTTQGSAYFNIMQGLHLRLAKRHSSDSAEAKFYNKCSCLFGDDPIDILIVCRELSEDVKFLNSTFFDHFKLILKMLSKLITTDNRVNHNVEYLITYPKAKEIFDKMIETPKTTLLMLLEHNPNLQIVMARMLTTQQETIDQQKSDLKAHKQQITTLTDVCQSAQAKLSETTAMLNVLANQISALQQQVVSLKRKREGEELDNDNYDSEMSIASVPSSPVTATSIPSSPTMELIK